MPFVLLCVVLIFVGIVIYTSYEYAGEMVPTQEDQSLMPRIIHAKLAWQTRGMAWRLLSSMKI